MGALTLGGPPLRKAVVYRFESESCGRRVSPRHMLGTLEAIAGLGGLPLLESRREVDVAALEGGFLFEPFNAIEPPQVVDIASRRMRVGRETV
jgi:hypothetical protein